MERQRSIAVGSSSERTVPGTAVNKQSGKTQEWESKIENLSQSATSEACKYSRAVHSHHPVSIPI